MNLEKFVHQWQLRLSTLNRSPNTIKAYSQDVFDFKNFFEDYHNAPLTTETFKTITPQDIRAWLL